MPYETERSVRSLEVRARPRSPAAGSPSDSLGAATTFPKRGVRVLVVDDHPLVRQGLRETIGREPDLVVCAEAQDCEGALAAAAAYGPDLAIVDLGLCDSSGLDLIKDLRQRYPKIRTLVFSMYDEVIYAEEAVRAGACGYVSKQSLTGKLVEAIRTVLRGEIYWSERAAALVASKVARSGRGGAAQPGDCLSSRELQVFEMIGFGSATSEIAAGLRIEGSTVESYRARIKRKLNLRDAGELLQSAIRWNLGRAGGRRVMGGNQ